MKKMYAFVNGKVALKEENGQLFVPEVIDSLSREDIAGILQLEDGDIATSILSEEQLSSMGLVLHDVRESRLQIASADFQAMCRAKQLLFWHNNTMFCPTCGAPTFRSDSLEKRCPKCGHLSYPPLAPAIIVRVERGADEILMVRAKSFRSDHYGLVAGFLEPGESLEECVARELMEETHIKVRNIKYEGSQPWPFPCGVMIAFSAEYESGDIIKQEEELVDAQWFHRDNLPKLPDGMSIARQLIDAWLKK
ncbi:MAG: NAD(+) diphosphatase [Bacteroidia bacterium]|nr:NAD(+) diphosphatase [Bacteroidia bacterium]